MLHRAPVALLMFVIATGAQGDPISLGIAPALSLRQKVIVLQAVLRPAGNAELQFHVSFPTNPRSFFLAKQSEKIVE